MKYSIYYDIFTNTYTAQLLGEEFSNCHGQSSTPENAVISLKIRLNQLRNKNS